MGVTCRSCKFFKETDGDALFSECTLFPKWEAVEHNHYCGQYKRRPKEQKKEKEEGTNTKSFIAHFCSKFREAYGVEYTVDWTADLVAIKKMLRENGEDKTLEYLSAFAKNPPKWYRDNNMIKISCIPKARNQINLRRASDEREINFVPEFFSEHAKNPDWPDYVDYKRKGGKSSYEEWRNNE